MPVQRIVFMQGEEANEAMSILDEHGADAAIEYLAEWDMGDGGEITDEPSAGESDDVYTDDNGYILTYNTGIPYIGLERQL